MESVKDVLDKYMERLRVALSPKVSESVVCMAEALCMPAFDGEALLRVCKTPHETTVFMCAFSSNLWFSKNGDEPTIIQEMACAPNNKATSFWKSMSELNPSLIRPQRKLGLDGMSIIATYKNGDIESKFETWSPDAESSEGQYVALICKLAKQVLKVNSSLKGLRGISKYL